MSYPSHFIYLSNLGIKQTHQTGQVGSVLDRVENGSAGPIYLQYKCRVARVNTVNNQSCVTKIVRYPTYSRKAHIQIEMRVWDERARIESREGEKRVVKMSYI